MLYYGDYNISLENAAKYSSFPVYAWERIIKDGLVLQNIDGTIPLESLPKTAQTAYLKDFLLKNQVFSANLIGLLDYYGPSYLDNLFETVQLILTAHNIKRNARGNYTKLLIAFLKSQHIQPRTFYSMEKQFMSTDFYKLTNGKKAYNSPLLCQLSEDYIKYYYSLQNGPTQNEILHTLIETAVNGGSKICTKCPYNPNSTKHVKWMKKFSESQTCTKAGNGMKYPIRRWTINTFCQTIPSEDIFFAKRGPNAWEAEFATKIIREKPSMANDVWFGDHNLADVMVVADEKNSILARPWLTVFTDAASNAIVGSVVSLRANSKTIAECFCRAVAFTVDSPFYGLPNTIYVDNGKDYRSEILKGYDPDSKKKLSDEKQLLNKDFSENKLLERLQVEVKHAKSRTGRSKVIENTFGIITRNWLRPIPGWCGNNPNNRPFDFQKEKKRLLKTGGLWTLEKFARYWFEFIVPEYNSKILSTKPGAKSHIETYVNLPKARNIVPDWDSLSVFKEKQKNYPVYEDGIHYRGEVYWHPDLQLFKKSRKEKKTYVSVYDFDQSFCHSITVVYQGRFICEAEPLVHSKINEKDSLTLRLHLEEQKKEKKNVSRRVQKCSQSLKIAGINTSRYVEYNPEKYYEESPIYTERIDDYRDKTESTMQLEEVSDISRILKTKQQTIDKILNGPKEEPISDFFQKIGESYD